MQIKGFQSNLINNIGRQGRRVVKDTGGQGRMKNTHTTITISFEILWLSIGLFQL